MTAARWLLRAFTVVVSNRGVPSGTDDRRLTTNCSVEIYNVYVRRSMGFRECEYRFTRYPRHRRCSSLPFLICQESSQE